ncbi:MAG: SurA N-terminal domain-containing protein [Alphaproteobacteria bacterium]|nr:SurA N-terminal domain-containing protein [Alphaproteobacteria bacterium]
MMRTLRLLAAALALFVVTTLGAEAAAIKVSVNAAEITDLQISARAGLMQLERRGTSNSNRLQMAMDELINEALMLEEAKRVGVVVSTAEIDAAFLTIARNTNLSADKLEAFLVDRGVNPQTLKDRLKANIAWQGVAQRVVAPRVTVSDLELEQKAQEQMKESLSYDYILKEVRFIVPQGSKTTASTRTAQANQYRKSFQGCDSAVDLSLSYIDVAVLDLGRRHATELPEALAEELAGLNVGGITKPRVADGGVSMLAVCAKASARDTTFVKDELRQEVGGSDYEKKAGEHLELLRSRATIIYR